MNYAKLKVILAKIINLKSKRLGARIGKIKLQNPTYFDVHPKHCKKDG